MAFWRGERILIPYMNIFHHDVQVIEYGCLRLSRKEVDESSLSELLSLLSLEPAAVLLLRRNISKISMRRDLRAHAAASASLNISSLML